MKQKILSLISCALIACNIFTTMSYAEESVEPPMENSETATDEAEFQEVEELETSDVETNEIKSKEESEAQEVEVEEKNTDEGEGQPVSDEANAGEPDAEPEDDKETFKVTFIDSIDNFLILIIYYSLF